MLGLDGKIRPTLGAKKEKPKWGLDKKITVFDLAREGVSDNTCQLVVRMMNRGTIPFTGRELWDAGKKWMKNHPDDHGITSRKKEAFIHLFGDPNEPEEWPDLTEEEERTTYEIDEVDYLRMAACYNDIRLMPKKKGQLYSIIKNSDGMSWADIVKNYMAAVDAWIK